MFLVVWWGWSHGPATSFSLTPSLSLFPHPSPLPPKKNRVKRGEPKRPSKLVSWKRKKKRKGGPSLTVSAAIPVMYCTVCTPHCQHYMYVQIITIVNLAYFSKMAHCKLTSFLCSKLICGSAVSFGVWGAALCTVQQEIGETIDDSFLFLYVVLVVQYSTSVWTQGGHWARSTSVVNGH